MASKPLESAFGRLLLKSSPRSSAGMPSLADINSRVGTDRASLNYAFSLSNRGWVFTRLISRSHPFQVLQDSSEDFFIFIGRDRNAEFDVGRQPPVTVRKLAGNRIVGADTRVPV